MTTTEIVKSFHRNRDAASALATEMIDLRTAIGAGRVARADGQLAIARLSQRAETLARRQAAALAAARGSITADPVLRAELAQLPELQARLSGAEPTTQRS